VSLEDHGAECSVERLSQLPLALTQSRQFHDEVRSYKWEFLSRMAGSLAEADIESHFGRGGRRRVGGMCAEKAYRRRIPRFSLTPVPGQPLTKNFTIIDSELDS
jgi:hypothetical protein